MRNLTTYMFKPAKRAILGVIAVACLSISIGSTEAGEVRCLNRYTGESIECIRLWWTAWLVKGCYIFDHEGNITSDILSEKEIMKICREWYGITSEPSNPIDDYNPPPNY
jgi:hypothetical protein